MKKILFVCTGNTCRSPMAEALLRHHGNELYQVQSAGVFAMSGEPASQNAILALKNKGIETNHSSQQVNEELLEWSSNVLSMTSSHKQMLVSKFPQYKEKIFTFYEYLNGQSKDISDPYGGSLSIYENTLNELEGLVKQIVQNPNE
ncbi:low molecular weight protein arginine phosphatase [Bacillus sp. AFS041924]|uniref:low molecular weight protein arginine phosphatase n=1 Tax=Bacillus sp. AFS041924 TaxID=2033503 RepID=UPI000BFB287A|nr:low molecular weight protein arginine phosphatase [Bacillus sp. AFS041924]PGS52724.1 low molecular weight phosphatase family protein [Bacillus sp. AFS041924]